MRGAILFLFFSLSALCVNAPSGQFDPSGYQLPEGAISLQYRGDYIEPYFATKALIVAQESGLDVRGPAQKWIQWLLPRQTKDGSFGRYCRKPAMEWHICAAADADDSMLALWLQLLYTNAPDSGIPVQWQESVRKANSALEQLRNSRLGVYHVSRQNHVALLMDNAEVYSALVAIARSQKRFRNTGASERTHDEAEKLNFAIQRVFWNKQLDWFRPSIQKSRPEFYPDVVAQVYPWLADMPMNSDVPERDEWRNWKSRFAGEWLAKQLDPHPWGLVAVAAVKFGDRDSASCWLSRSEPLRFSTNWNVLEEAAFQAVEFQIGQTNDVDPSACSKVATQQ